MSDEKPLGSEALQQRQMALSRWENEGGSGPPEKTTSAGKLVFNASILTPNAKRRGPVTERDALRAACGSSAAAAGAGSQFPPEARVTTGVTARLKTDPACLRKDTPLYPLRFEPIYQYRLWGGRRLKDLLSAPLPGRGPVGEAWLLSDRDDHPSLVADGPFKGQTIARVLERSPEQLLGQLHGRLSRFPLLLKFLDVRKSLSVQVHPSDAYEDLIPPGNSGKSEAWVVLEAGPEARIYAGLKPGTTAEALRQAIMNGTVDRQLASFAPQPGDSVLVRAGIVHSLRDVVVFEVQQNSDVTFRLYDWGNIDPETGQVRSLQVDKAMECIDWGQAAINPVAPLVQETRPVLRESLVQCEHFDMTRISGQLPFVVGATGMPSVLVCLAGEGHVQYAGTRYTFDKGDVLLLPAVVGPRSCEPRGVVSLLELSLPYA
jgi:mannose-6-phosphate isomerase